MCEYAVAHGERRGPANGLRAKSQGDSAQRRTTRDTSWSVPFSPGALLDRSD
jgi:hypothetical protein